MSKKDDENMDKDRLLLVVQEFCISKKFEQEFEAFAKEHSDVFLQALDFTEDTSEHPLEFHEVYRKYLTKFEGLIEDFIVESGYSVGDFYDQCKEILENDEVFGTKRFFIETMMATSEYVNFFMLMKAEMREHKQALAKASHK